MTETFKPNVPEQTERAKKGIESHNLSEFIQTMQMDYQNALKDAGGDKNKAYAKFYKNELAPVSAGLNQVLPQVEFVEGETTKKEQIRIAGYTAQKDGIVVFAGTDEKGNGKQIFILDAEGNFCEAQKAQAGGYEKKPDGKVYEKDANGALKEKQTTTTTTTENTTPAPEVNNNTEPEVNNNTEPEVNNTTEPEVNNTTKPETKPVVAPQSEAPNTPQPGQTVKTRNGQVMHV